MWTHDILVLEIMVANTPEMEPYAYLFNWFFSLLIMFTLIAILISLILRPLTRS